MIIRPFEQKDLDAVVRLESLLYKDPWTKKEYQDELDNQYAYVFVLEEQEHIIGYYGVWIVSDAATITKVSVHPALQNKGLGKILMEDLLDRCQEAGAVYVSLEVRVSNEPAKHLYELNGFKNAGIRKRYYKDGEDAYAMVKYFPGGEDYETIYIRN